MSKRELDRHPGGSNTKDVREGRLRIHYKTYSFSAPLLVSTRPHALRKTLHQAPPPLSVRYELHARATTFMFSGGGKYVEATRSAARSVWGV